MVNPQEFWQASTFPFSTVPNAPTWRNRCRSRRSWRRRESFERWCHDFHTKQTQRLQPRHTHPTRNRLPYLASCSHRKDTTSLRGSSLWGLRASLSWEPLWRYSCFLNPSSAQFSGSLGLIQSAPPLRWGPRVCFSFCLRFTSADCNLRDEGKKNKQGRHKTQRKGEEVQTSTSYVRLWLCELMKRQCVWLRWEALLSDTMTSPCLLLSPCSHFSLLLGQ